MIDFVTYKRPASESDAAVPDLNAPDSPWLVLPSDKYSSQVVGLYEVPEGAAQTYNEKK